MTPEVEALAAALAGINWGDNGTARPTAQSLLASLTAAGWTLVRREETLAGAWASIADQLPEGWSFTGLYQSYHSPRKWTAHVQGPYRRHSYYGDDSLTPLAAIRSLASKLPAILAGEKAGLAAAPTPESQP